MTTAPSFIELVSIVNWIQDKTAGITFRKVDRRVQMATGCLDLAIEHQSGIAVLFDQQRVGSAFALMRPLVDSFIRGVWLSRCASEEGLDKFQQGRLGKKHSFASLVVDVESFLGKRDTALSRLTGRSWNFMSDFTHTGFEHVTRRHSATHLGPNYPPAEIEQMIRSACTIGLLATVELVDLAGDRNLAQACKQRLTAFVATRAPDNAAAGCGSNRTPD